MAIKEGYIEKKQDDSSLYTQFVKEGISIIQKIASDSWTDHNEHDPGITILESIAYSLTELNYKIQFPIKDLLIQNEKHELASGENSLFTCSNILTTNPITKKDLRKVIIDKVEAINNVWIEDIDDLVETSAGALQVTGILGLFQISVELKPMHQDLMSNEKALIETQVRRIFHECRNLGEYITDVIILEPLPFDLKIDITIEENSNGETVLANVYQTINQYLSQEVEFRTLKDLQSEGYPINEIFNGPKLDHGFILSDSLKKRLKKIRKTDIDSLIASCAGVMNIHETQIFLSPGSNEMNSDEFEIPQDKYPMLVFPKTNESTVFRTFGLTYKADLEHLERELAYLRAESYRNEQVTKTKSDEIDIPKGSFLDIGESHPLNYQFPDIYGIGEDGLQSNASEERKAQAKQLEAFLFPIDQLMSNTLASLVHLFRLFDVSNESYSTYFSKALPNMEEVKYLIENENQKFNQWEKDLEKLTREFDSDKFHRLNVLTNDLLSRFSEKFEDYLITKTFLNNYRSISNENVKINLLNTKRDYLENFDLISYNRNKATNIFDLSRQLNQTESDQLDADPYCSFLKQVAVFSGIFDYSMRRVTQKFDETMAEAGLDHLIKEGENVDCIFLKELMNSQDEDLFKIVANASALDTYDLILETKSASKILIENVQYQECLDRIAKLKRQLERANLTCEGLFLVENITLFPRLRDKRFGYSIELELPNTSTPLHFEIEEKFEYLNRNESLKKFVEHIKNRDFDLRIERSASEAYVIANFKNLPQAKALISANHFSDSISDSDIVESIKIGISNFDFGNIEAFIKKWCYFDECRMEESVFSMKLTLILPDWSSRFQDSNFKGIFESTVYECIPAHLIADVLWLNYNDMKEFEDLFFIWARSILHDHNGDRKNYFHLINFIHSKLVSQENE